MVLYQISAFTTHWKILKKSYKNIDLNISFKVEFKLMGSFSVSDFEYIIKKHETLTDNLSKRIYVNKIEKRLHLKFKKENIILNF